MKKLFRNIGKRKLKLLFCVILALAGFLQGYLPFASSETESAVSVTTESVVTESACYYSSETDVIPSYTGEPYVVLDGNVPSFTAEELSVVAVESYSELDPLGRCGVAFAKIGLETMSTEERGEIGSVKPTGWHTVKYDCVDGNYLYNRCHLIGFQLAGENANEKNLITGTRYFNVTGMLPFENEVADYVEETGNHVLYRVTPVYDGDNLVASGVKMEAQSIEDDTVQFSVFVFNVQPGITIDYATGESREE